MMNEFTSAKVTNDFDEVSDIILPWDLVDDAMPKAEVISEDNTVIADITNVEGIEAEVEKNEDSSNVADSNTDMELPSVEVDTSNTVTEDVSDISETVDSAVPVTEETTTEEPAPIVATVSEESVSEDNAEKTDDKTSESNPVTVLDTIHTLTSVPAGDLNFVKALEGASMEELKEALDKANEIPYGNKTRITRIEARIKKLEKAGDKDTADTADKDTADTADDDASKDDIQIPTEPVFKEDEYQKLEGQDLSDKEKAILYMLNHYHISPDLLNNLLEGNFEESWKEISEINNINQSVKAKLEKELKGADDDRIKVVRYLVDKASKEPEFAKQILLEHKDFSRCYKTYTEKVRELFIKGHKNGECIQVDDDKIYQYAVDYYWLDDFEQVMKERHEAEERKKKAEEAKKKAAAKKKTPKKTAKADSKEEVNTEEKSEDKTEAVTEEKTDFNTEENTADKAETSVENTDIEKTDTATADDAPLIVPAITENEEKLIEEAVKEDEKKKEEAFAIADSFGQLTFSF